MAWILVLWACTAAPSTDTAVDSDTDPVIDSDVPTPVEPTWDGGVASMLETRCGPCHTGYDFGDLAVTDPSDLIDVPSSVGMPLVSPGSTADSYIWHKVHDTHLSVGGTGDRMPLDVAPLTPDEMQLLADWITDGAP